MNPSPAEQAAMQASLYCQMITGQENPAINVLFMPDSGADPSAKPFSLFDTADRCLLRAYELQQQGYTPHLLLQETEGDTARKKDITSCRVWVLDIDTPIEQQQLVQLCERIRPSFVVSTSPGKYHLYYLAEKDCLFSATTNPKNHIERYAYWIQAAKALIATAWDMGIDVDSNYTQITKRCRIPGFQRRTKDGQVFIPQIIWADGKETADIPRHTYHSLAALIGEESQVEQAVTRFNQIQSERKRQIREASISAVRQTGTVPGQLCSGDFDFSHLKSGLDVATPEIASAGYPEAHVGNRNDTLFSYMYHLCKCTLHLLTETYDTDAILTLLYEVASTCNDKHSSPLEDDEVERISSSAYEYAVSRMFEQKQQQQKTREEVVSTPIPSGETAPESRAYDYDYTRIDLAAPFSDEAIADRIIQRFGHLIMRIGDSEAIAMFDGIKWSVGRAHKEVSLSSMYNKVVDDVPFEPCFQMYITDNNGAPSRAKIERLLEALRSDYRFKRVTACLVRSNRIATLPAEDFIELPHILNVRNGNLNLKTGELMGHEPWCFSKAVAGVSYQAGAECPNWDAYLDSVFGTGEDGDRLRDYVQRLCGYLISGHMNEQVMVLLFGQGSNGKSVLTRTLDYLLGEYSGVGDESDFGAGKKGGLGTGKMSERVMAKFVGKRLVLGSEFSKDTRLKEEAVKRITGQDPAPARYLYGEAFRVVPTFKVVIGTNHLPHVEDDSLAVWRRVHIVPFSFSFFSDEERSKFEGRVPADTIKEKVSDLDDRLKAELPGILNWCLQGYQMWMERGLTDQPDVMKQELAAAQFDNNMAQEIMARCIVDLAEDDDCAGMTSTEIANAIKREVGTATGQAAQDISVSARSVGKYHKQIRRLKRVSTRFDDGRVLKLYRVKLDLSRAPMLDN